MNGTLRRAKRSLGEWALSTGCFHMSFPMRCFAAAFFGLLGLASFTTVINARPVGWDTYVNPDWGYSIDFPVYLFGPPEIAEDRGGLDFTSLDGQARLFLFAGPAPGVGRPAEIADYLSNLDDVHQVTYRRVTPSWIVISGFISEAGQAPGNIFYERLALSPDYSAVSGFRLEYPATERPVYDGLIGRIGRSLTPPQRSGPPPLADLAPAVAGSDTPLSGDTATGPGDAHVEACRSRYRTYDMATGTYLRFDGIRVRCTPL